MLLAELIREDGGLRQMITYVVILKSMDIMTEDQQMCSSLVITFEGCQKIQQIHAK